MTTIEQLALSFDEQQNLNFLENRIEQALKFATAASITIATCLKQIHEQRLYKTYGTFDNYCRDRWQKGRHWGYHLIEAAQVLNTLTAAESVDNCQHSLPENEAQIRPLTRLAPEQQTEAWHRANVLADQEGASVTGRHVQQAVSEIRNPPIPFVPDEDNEPLSDYEQGIARYFEAHPERSRHVCGDCGEIFDIEVWHCPHCAHHWQMHVIECRNCHEYERPATAHDSDTQADIRHQRMSVVVYSSESNEWYTPAWVTALACKTMGAINLDPASSQSAQSIHEADEWYGLDHPDTSRRDGLAQQWNGCIWLNPPYGRSEDGHNAQLWSRKLINEYESGRVTAGILLVKAALGYNWFEELWRAWPTCLLRERLSFVRPDGTDDGQSKQATALIYVGTDIERFCNTFRPFGRVIMPETTEIGGRA